MAEFVLKDLVQKTGRASHFEIASAATSTEEIGNPVYPPARQKLAEHHISCAGKTARQLTRTNCDYYDLLIAMDYANRRNIERVCGPGNTHKIHLLMEYAGSAREVADPWYTGDFEQTWKDVLEGCQGLLKVLKQTL